MQRENSFQTINEEYKLRLKTARALISGLVKKIQKKEQDVVRYLENISDFLQQDEEL